MKAFFERRKKNHIHTHKYKKNRKISVLESSRNDPVEMTEREWRLESWESGRRMDWFCCEFECLAFEWGNEFSKRAIEPSDPRDVTVSQKYSTIYHAPYLFF